LAPNTSRRAVCEEKCSSGPKRGGRPKDVPKWRSEEGVNAFHHYITVFLRGESSRRNGTASKAVSPSRGLLLVRECLGRQEGGITSPGRGEPSRKRKEGGLESADRSRCVRGPDGLGGRGFSFSSGKMTRGPNKMVTITCGNGRLGSPSGGEKEEAKLPYSTGKVGSAGRKHSVVLEPFLSQMFQ